MRSIVRRASFALAALAVATVSAVAQDVRVLTFDAPPFSAKSPVTAGKRGIYVEIVEAVLKDLGIAAKVEFVGNAEGQKIAQQNANVVFFPLARNAEREGLYRWIGSVMNQELGFATLAEKGPITSLDEGRKVKRLGAIEGSSALRYIEARGFDNIVRGSSADIVRMLARGEIDAYFQRLRHPAQRRQGAGHRGEVRLWIRPGRRQAVDRRRPEFAGDRCRALAGQPRQARRRRDDRPHQERLPRRVIAARRPPARRAGRGRVRSAFAHTCNKAVAHRRGVGYVNAQPGGCA